MEEWFASLNEVGRMHYVGTCHLSPSAHQSAWIAYNEFMDLDNRVYRPFNEETMEWDDYVRTSDYLVHRHHERKKFFFTKKARDDEKRCHLRSHGVALAESMSVDEYSYCEACEMELPEQTAHACLGFD